MSSGLRLDAPPFNLEIHDTLCEVALEDKTVIRTVLIVNERQRDKMSAA